MKLTFRKNNLFLFIVLFLSILPIINIRTFEMPVLYLLLPIGGVVFMLLVFGMIKVPKIVKSIILFFLLIIIGIFISTLHGTTIFGSNFTFPREIIQYVARMLSLITFTMVFYKGKVEADVFIKYFLFFLNLAMLVGILQWIPWPGRELFINLYPFQDGATQISQLNRSLHNIRVHGVAQHATGNGGLAMFFFVIGYSVYKYYKKYQFLSIMLMILSIINIFASQARAGILGFLSAVLLFYIVDLYVTRKGFKTTLYFIVLMIALSFTIWTLYENGNLFINQMVYRWEVLFETSGGGRTGQVSYFMHFFNNILTYLFGISRQVISKTTIPHGVEIEPVNTFISYGIIGIIAHYGLILLLLIYFFKNIRKIANNNVALTLLISSFVGLLSYQVFSVGYFFFREIRVGLFPWILMGVAIGVLERGKLMRRGD